MPPTGERESFARRLKQIITVAVCLGTCTLKKGRMQVKVLIALVLSNICAITPVACGGGGSTQ